MLLKKRSRISSLAPLSASVSPFLSARWTISRMPVSSTCTQVVEHEHQVADRHRQVGPLRLDGFEHRRADVALEAVEQLGDGADAAVLLARAAAERLQPLLDDASRCA